MVPPESHTLSNGHCCQEENMVEKQNFIYLTINHLMLEWMQHQNSRASACLTLILVSHCLMAVKLCSAVMSYITTTPSALRKNCLVMLRYLQQEVDKMFAEPLTSLNSNQNNQNQSSLHLSCPAVSHICSATWLLSTVIVFTL